MSEPAPPSYVVRDYCATCGERLQPAPLGGRYACHPNDGWYWSEAEPLAEDVSGFGRLTGLYPRMQTEWIDMRRDSPTLGIRITHKPLWLYRSAA